MTRPKSALVVVLLGFSVGFLGGIAWATHGHTINGIYHGPYFEYKSGDDYHHSWTEHGHDGYRWTAIFKGDGTKVAAGSNAQSNYVTRHVHKTAHFVGTGFARFKTNNPNASNQCNGEQGTSSYGDGHGICKHRMDFGAES